MSTQFDFGYSALTPNFICFNSNYLLVA